MKELIELLRLGASISRERRLSLDYAKVADKAADALERLTQGDVGLPEPDVINKYPTQGYYTEQKLLDYGNRRAAAAVLADEALMRECLIELWCYVPPKQRGDLFDKLKARLGEK
jgi:hypothetical protein